MMTLYLCYRIYRYYKARKLLKLPTIKLPILKKEIIFNAPISTARS